MRRWRNAFLRFIFMGIVEGVKCVIQRMAAKQPNKPTNVRPVMNYKN